MPGLLTLNALASPLSICLVSEPCRVLSRVAQGSGAKVKDSRNLLDEVSPEKGIEALW